MTTHAGESIPSAISLVFSDASQELTAWLQAKLTEIDASTDLSSGERAAGRILAFADLGRRASRVIDQAREGSR